MSGKPISGTAARRLPPVARLVSRITAVFWPVMEVKVQTGPRPSLVQYLLLLNPPAPVGALIIVRLIQPHQSLGSGPMELVYKYGIAPDIGGITQPLHLL